MVFCECFVALVLINGALSAIISSPGINRVYVGDSCTFQWTFTGPANSYEFLNLTTTPPSVVSRQTSQINRTTGIITLTITNVALWDAGNYSLIIENTNDTTALLYVYQTPETPRLRFNDYRNMFPVVEGGRMEISCSSGGINSRPSGYAIQLLYVFERDGQQITSGVDRHDISRNYLTIYPVMRDDHGRVYRCKKQETGSRLESNYSVVFKFTLHEFTSQPTAIQRIDQGQDYYLTWKLSYNICDILTNYDFRIPYLDLTLTLSPYRTIGSTLLVGLRCLRDDVFPIYGVHYTRASFNVENNSISFFLSNIVIIDAGEYTLILEGAFSHKSQQHTTTLFVNAPPSVKIVLLPNLDPFPRGSTAQVICSANSTSIPEIHRQPLNYTWRISGGYTNTLSDEYVELDSGSVSDCYTISSDMKILTISSALAADNIGFGCCASEQGSQIRSCSWVYPNISDTPFIVNTVPFGRRINAVVPSRVRLEVAFRAFPSFNYTTWTFVDRNGDKRPLPDSSASSYDRLQFILSSSRLYGMYTLFVNNSYGATQTAFTVAPPARPDTPTQFQSYYLTSSSIFLQWNCSWDNGLQQFFIVQLKETTRSRIIETKNITSPIGCLNNVTLQVKFESNVQPVTDYEASLWSSNDLGSSDVVNLTIKTPTRPKLVISSESISINETIATIDYSIANGKAVQMKVECCVETQQVCVESYFDVTNGSGQVLLTNIPNASQYAFQFYLYDGPQQNDSLVAFTKEIEISLAGDEIKGTSSSSLLPAVIVLAILFGVTLVLGAALAFVIFRRQLTMNSAPRSTEQNKCATTPKGVANAAVPDSAANADAMPSIYEGLAEIERYQEQKSVIYECLNLE